MTNSQIEDKLLKDLSYRKKPKQLYYNKSKTWSSSSAKHQSYNKLDITNFSGGQALPIEERIKLYEAKCMQCLNSQTQLSAWIQLTKEKGPPKPLIEGHYTPPARPRRPEFLFSSLSTKPRRKTNCDAIAPTAKSSLSTFLKKATDSLSTTYKHVPPLKRQQKIPKTPIPIACAPTKTTTTTHTSNHRFSLTSSLNRFSLAKTVPHNAAATVKKSSYANIETKTESKKSRSSSKHDRFSTPLSEIKPATSCSDKPNQNNLRGLRKEKLEKPRPQSTILPHSPSSSIFLDRLRSRAPGYDIDQTIQSNVSSVAKPTISYSCLQNSTSSIGITDYDTPPSSPSSIDSVSTSPSITTLSLASTTTRRKRSQDFLFLGKHKSSLLTAAERNGFLVDDVIVEDECEDVFIRDYPLKNVPLQQTQKKKHASLLIVPSLSSLRLLSHKSQFLKRQSMLT